MNDRIIDKLDKVLERQQEHGELLARHTVLHEQNTVDLEEHIRRTNLLEESLKPLKQTDTIIRAGLKAVGVVGTLLTIIYTAMKIIGI